ncbi:hypothetical protein H4R34_006020, partial [Dimargaris verticillata]
LPWDSPLDKDQRRYSLRIDQGAVIQQLLPYPGSEYLSLNHGDILEKLRFFDLAQGLTSGYYHEVLGFIGHFFQATNAPGLVDAFRAIPDSNYGDIIDHVFIDGTDDELRYILEGIMVYRIIPHMLATLVWELNYEVIPAFVQALLAIPQLCSRIAEDPYISINYMETAVVLAASLDDAGDFEQMAGDDDMFGFIRAVHRERSIWQYPRIYQCLLSYSDKRIPAVNLLNMLGETEAGFYQWQVQSSFDYEHCDTWINSNTDVVDFRFLAFSLYFV